MLFSRLGSVLSDPRSQVSARWCHRTGSSPRGSSPGTVARIRSTETRLDDAATLASELLRALRGTRSQTAFCRRLGYRSNVAYLWESGQRFPNVDAFFHAVRRTGGDPTASIARFAGPAAPPPDDARGLAAVLDALRGEASVSEIARRMGRSRSAVARWLAGEAQPRLPELLDLVDALTGRPLDLVAAFVDPREVPSAAPRWERIQAARALSRASPWAGAVLLALELADYRAHPEPPDGWLADRLGIPAALEAESIGLLAAAGQIRRVGPRWTPVAVATLDLRAPGERVGTPLRGFWARVARERLLAGADGLLSWNLAAISRDDLARIQNVQRRAFHEIRAIVASSAPAEELVLLSWALTALTTRTSVPSR